MSIRQTLSPFRARSGWIQTLCLALLILCVAPIQAQDDDVEEDDRTLIVYGEVATGQLNDITPMERYVFEALRCDFIKVRLVPTTGTLDPIITILDGEDNLIFSRDDSGGQLGVVYEPLFMPESGFYTIVVGRFGYGLGSTYGAYELLVERIGKGSASGCGLRYGDEVINTVDDTTPEVFYFFRAQQGDIVNIQMESRSGDLDPYLRVLKSNGSIITENDDTLGAGNDAVIQAFLIPETGTYYIVASRYGDIAGESEGTFKLALQETDYSGLGNSPIAPRTIRPGGFVEAELTNQQFVHYYRFEAQQNDLISVRMDRVPGGPGRVDSYLVIANAVLQELALNDDSIDIDGNRTQNARIDDFLIPADGTYYILATRFEREEGDSTGAYRLELIDHGNAFESVPPDVRQVSYGVTLTGRIDEITPQIRYAFRGVEGDVIRVSMTRGDGDLDPLINIRSENETILFSDDDTGGNQNALIEQYTIPYTGIFYLEATRYTGADNPNTRGSFTLVLAQRRDQGQ